MATIESSKDGKSKKGGRTTSGYFGGCTRLLPLLVSLLLLTVALLADTTTTLPDSDINSVWTALGGGSRFSEVDDPVGTPDDDTTYISTTVNEDTQALGFPALVIPNGSTIASVQVIIRGERAGGGDCDIMAYLHVNGSAYNGGVKSFTSSYTTTTSTFTTNPDTSLAWTEADVEGTGANPIDNRTGAESRNMTSGSCRVTQVYRLANYTPSGAAAPHSLLLMGVGK